MSHVLHPNITAAMARAGAFAAAEGAERIEVFHLYHALMETEPQDGAARCFFRQMSPQSDELAAALRAHFQVPASTVSQTAAGSSEQCRNLFRTAAAICFKHGCQVIDGAHVAEAMLSDRFSYLAELYGDLVAAAPESAAPTGKFQRSFVAWASHHRSFAWIFPYSMAAEVMAALEWRAQFENVDPDLSLTFTVSVLAAFPAARLQLWTLRVGSELRLWCRPFERMSWPWGWFKKRLLQRIASDLDSLYGARRLGPGRFFPFVDHGPSALAGGLNRDWFQERSPVGTLRPWNTADTARCVEIYALLEQRNHLPEGFAKDFAAYLRDAKPMRLVIEHEGKTCGFGAVNIDRYGPIAGHHRHLIPQAWVAFGIIHPDFHRKGLGRTLMAARLWLAHRQEKRLIGIESTEQARFLWDHVGFRFNAVQRQSQANLYSGSLLLTEDDGSFLNRWLGTPDLEGWLKGASSKAATSFSSLSDPC